MLLEPGEIDRSRLLELLNVDYGIAASDLIFLPVGGDSFNYRAADGRGGRWFVNVKRTPPFPRPRGGRAGLEASYRLAVALRDRADLGFLSCPIATRRGELVTAMEKLPVAVFPFLAGRSRPAESDDERDAIAGVVRRLHQATDIVRELDLPVEGFEPNFETTLLAAMQRALATGAAAGPHGTWLRERMSANRERLLGLLARFHELRASALAGGRAAWVVTHGEPYGNTIWDAAGSFYLVDCGELCLAPAERDLVSLELPDGRTEPSELYSLRWILGEVAEYADQLSRPHQGTAEDERCRQELALYLE